MSTLGERIRQLRESKNLTQTQLAEQLDMKTYTTVSKWESNDNFPKGKDLKTLAKLFNVSSDYLLGLDKNKTPLEIDKNNTSREVVVTKNDIALLNKINSLSPENREFIISTIEHFYKTDSNK